MPERYDVVIAGAGIAGLSLAALLASGGDRSVLLLERSPAAGGRFEVRERDGYRLDWGVHACLLGSRGSIARVLRRCGVDVPIIPAGMALYSGSRLKPFIDKSVLSVTRQKVVGAKDLLRFGKAAMTNRANSSCAVSVSDWLERSNASQALGDLMRALSVGLLATDRYDRASSGELFSFMRQVSVAMMAAGYPRGGWGPVLDGLLRVVEGSPGCGVALGTPLERIIAAEKKVEAVVAGGEVISTGAVVCALPPQVFASEITVDPPLPPDYGERLSSLEESFGLCIEMGLERPVTRDSRIVFALGPPALLWAVSNISPEVAPEGKQLLQFFSPLSRDQAEDGSLVEERETGLVELAEEVFGRPLPEEWRRVMVTTIGGVVPITGQARPDRPGIKVPGYRGLFLIGDGVGSRGLGGDLAARSALDAERELAGL
jgi:phytoene dehydrogenase-like protein